MLKIRMLAAASVLPMLLFGSGALAGTFRPVAAPEGSLNAGVLGINDQGEVAGSYSTDGVDLHGFVGSIDGNYQTFDVDGNPTQARSLNNQGRIVGFYTILDTLNEFERAQDGTIVTIVKDGAPLEGIAQGVNAAGEFSGDYLGAPGSTPRRGGYKGKDGAFQSDVTLPFPAVRVAARGINSKGDIAGWFVADAGGNAQGFVMQKNGTTVLNHPGAVMTFVQGINNKGELSGSWEDAGGNSHGFALAADLVTWTSFDAPTGTQTQAWQINNLGQIAVDGFDDASSAMYIYCPRKGGVCTGKNETAGTEKSAKGKSGLHAPEPGHQAADPDATPPKKHGHRH
ncbi:MAG: hypothetical protein AAB227_06465 [Pseudomonadota bacterium]